MLFARGHKNIIKIVQYNIILFYFISQKFKARHFSFWTASRILKSPHEFQPEQEMFQVGTSWSSPFWKQWGYGTSGNWGHCFDQCGKKKITKHMVVIWCCVMTKSSEEEGWTTTLCHPKKMSHQQSSEWIFSSWDDDWRFWVLTLTT